jgi:murein DD-endopeptidase MepM/ murein hydrolase activator NlpD
MVPCSYVLLSSPFGNRTSPTAGASSNHQGIDLAGSRGTPIKASKAGVVTVRSSSRSAGNYVTIKHDNTYSSIYMHLENSIVSKGQTVSQGQVIGYMGDSGIVTGVHLHFGIIKNGSYVNPANYMYFHP